MGKNKNSLILTVKKDDLKGNELKSRVVKKYMKDIKMVMKEEDSKEYENLFNALNIDVKKI